MLALEGVYDSIKAIHDFEIVGTYSEEKELLKSLETNDIQILILNLMLKSSQGFEILKNIREVKKDIKIIILTEEDDKVGVERARELGVNAFLKKDTSCSELISAIISVGKGNDIIPDTLYAEEKNVVLSETETQVLKLIVKEYTNAQIAKELYISNRTVESHVTNICRKLGVYGRIGIVREAIRLNLV
jgi:two-component system vancomycin resistance associated response regulator VraR